MQKWKVNQEQQLSVYMDPTYNFDIWLGQGLAVVTDK